MKRIEVIGFVELDGLVGLIVGLISYHVWDTGLRLSSVIYVSAKRKQNLEWTSTGF